MLRISLILLFSLSLGMANAINLDSLWNIWNDESNNDSSRLEAIRAIAWDGYVYTKPDSAFYFAQLEYDYAYKKGLKKYMADAMNIQGVTIAIRGDYLTAMDYFNRCIKLREQIGNVVSSGGTYNNMGLLYYNKGDYKNSLIHFKLALDICKGSSDTLGEALVLGNIGNIYFDQEDYNEAMKIFTQALELNIEVSDNMGTASSLLNIGNIYRQKGDYPKALRYYKEALNINIKINTKIGIADALNSIGELNCEKRYYAEAIKYHNSALEINNDIQDKKGIAQTLQFLGLAYKGQQKISDAINISLKSMKLYQEMGELMGIKKVSIELSELYKIAGNHKAGLEMHEFHMEICDSIANEENTKATIQKKFEVAYREKAIADSVKNAEMQKLKDAKLEAQEATIEKEVAYRNGLMGGLILIGAFLFLLFNRFKVTRTQKHIIEEKNQQITDSIRYAKRIQEASLASKSQMDKTLNEYFVYYQPKDIVSGDFYWLHQLKDGKMLLAVADCTGHGVPGAFMSMLGTALLNEVVIENGVHKVDEILETMRTRIIKGLHQDEGKVKTMDGLDISLLSFDPNTNNLDFVGAGHTMYIVEKEVCTEVSGDNFPVGYFYGKEKPYTLHKVPINSDQTVYLTTDGMIDQFGGNKQKKYGLKNFKDLILSLSSSPIADQKAILDNTMKEWKGKTAQVDDMLVMGLRF